MLIQMMVLFQKIKLQLENIALKVGKCILHLLMENAVLCLIWY